MSNDWERRARLFIASLFFLSGATSLIYQIVWVRMLVLVFGTTVFAVSTVLSAFMAGLALGSAYFGRRIDHRGNGLRLYAGLELFIGLFALAFIPLLAGLDNVYTAGYRLLQEHSYLFALFRFVLTFLVLLVPATLMGGTLPVLSKFVTRRLSGVGRTVGSLYAINTLGAAVGCFSVAFLLLERLGINGTILVAGATNLLIAAAALVLSLRVKRPEPEPAGAIATPAETEPPLTVTAPQAIRAVFWGYALSGFVALGYEVLWTRLLSIVLRLTTAQSLSAILIVFLSGLAAGAALATRFVDRSRNLLRAFGVTELALGLFGLGSVAAFGAIPGVVSALGPAQSWWAHTLRVLVVASVVMLIPTLLMGVLFPIAGRLRVQSLDAVGRRIGGIYAANTTGAIFGAFSVGFVLIPLLGTQRSIQLLAWINIAIGVAVLLLDSATRRRTRAVAIAAVAIAALALTGLPKPGFLIDRFRPQSGGELLYHDEGAAGTVTVLEFERGNRLLRVNGAGEVPTDHASIQIFRLLGSLPLVIHPAADDLLVIAFGGGVTLSTVELERPRHIDCVEVVPGVIGAAPYFSDYNNRIFERLDGGRIDLIVDDGRNHVLRTPRTYDVIISDSTHPRTADSWVLYTQDFYELCKRRLKQGGYVAQWLPLHGLTVDDYKMIVRTFHSVFPHSSVWLNTNYSVLLGAPEPLQIDFDALQSRLRTSAVRESLEQVDLGDPISLLTTLALKEDAIPGYVGEGPINTDDRPFISFGDRRRSQSSFGLPVMISLVPHLPQRLDDLVTAAPAELRALEQRLRSRRHMLTGAVASRVGLRPRALAELKEARRLDPGEREAQRILAILAETGR